MEGAEPTRFFVIGAPKCGTTSLCSILAEHPEVGFSIPKEPRFFSHDEIYARGFDWYHGLFPERDGKKSVGEGSTSYATDSRDTLKVLSIARPGAFILWHDFNLGLTRNYGWIHSVCSGVEALFREGKLRGRVIQLRDSWVGLYRVPADRGGD